MGFLTKLLTKSPHPHNSSSCKSILHVLEDKVQHVPLLAQNRQDRCIGSSHGWMITVVDKSSTNSLLNLHTKEKIRLPPMNNIPTFQRPGKAAAVYNLVSSLVRDDDKVSVVVHKVIWIPEICTAMAIYGKLRELALWKQGDETWTVIEDSNYFYEDIIYYEGHIFAVDECGGVIYVDTDHPFKVTQFTPPWFFQGGKVVYLVGTQLGLLLVHRYIDDNCSTSIGFKVFRLRQVDWKWIPVKSLGHWMLFLVQNYSVCVSSYVCPQFRKGNHIYFTDHCLDGRAYDQGSFNLSDDTIRQLVLWPKDQH